MPRYCPDIANAKPLGAIKKKSQLLGITREGKGREGERERERELLAGCMFPAQAKSSTTDFPFPFKILF